MGSMKVWDGTTWQTVSQSGPEGTVWVGTEAPATAEQGDLWYDTDDTSSMLTLPLTVAQGGTGASAPPAARTNLAVPAVGQSPSVAGAPTTGTWARGDLWLDVNNVRWMCTTAGTPGTWASMNIGEELAYNQITAQVSLTSTNIAAPNTIVAGTTRTYDGSPLLLEFYSPRVDAPVNGQALIHLWDGGTNLGYFVLVLSQNPGVTGTTVTAKRRIVPTAGSHTYNVMGWVGGGTGTVGAGAGDAPQAFHPAYLRVTRA